MKSKPIHYLVLDLVFFMATIGICVLISPVGLKDNHGVSYYERYGLTMIPYAVGFLAISILTFLVARLIPRASHKLTNFRYALFAISFLTLGVLATPDYINSFFNYAHVTVSTILFIIEFVLAGWFAIFELKDRLNLALMLALFFAGLVAFASNTNWTRYLFISEVTFQLIFFLIFLRTASKVKLLE